MEITADTIKSYLLEKGITQGEMADKIGVTRRTLSNYLTGDKEIPLSIKKLLEYEIFSHSAKIEDNLEADLIPLLPISAQGGSLTEFTVQLKDNGNDWERIVSPIKNVDFAIPISGDSMAPEYPQGAKVLIKKINEKAFIEWGKVYVLDTCNGIIIKKVEPIAGEDNCVLCVSLNPNYKPFKVCFSDINGFYRVLMVMSLK